MASLMKRGSSSSAVQATGSVDSAPAAGRRARQPAARQNNRSRPLATFQDARVCVASMDASGVDPLCAPSPPPPRNNVAMFLTSINPSTAAPKPAPLVKWIPYPRSLQELLSMPLHFGSLDCFVEFSRTEYSAENIQFWRELQHFKISHHHPRLKAYWRSATEKPHADAAEKGPIKQLRAATEAAASGRDSPLLSERSNTTPASADDDILMEPYKDQDLQLAMCSNARFIFCKYLIADAEFEVRWNSLIVYVKSSNFTQLLNLKSNC